MKLFMLMNPEYVNFAFGKIEPRSRKTDPFMALVAAFCVADRLDEPEPTPIEMMTPFFL